MNSGGFFIPFQFINEKVKSNEKEKYNSIIFNFVFYWII